MKCKECDGELTQKRSGPHIGLYCVDCGKWQRWIKQGGNEMNFEVNYDDVFEGNDLIPEGEYEVIVKKAEEKEVKDGSKKYISIQLSVRNDIDQRYKNKIIFESLWKAKATGKYNMRQFNTISKALKIQNGKKYESLDELLSDWDNKTVMVKIKHEEYNGYTNARVAFWSESKFKDCNHTWADKSDVQAITDMGFSPLADADDDVPF